MFYPQFDMCPPPEPFFSRAGGRKWSRVQIIGFLGLHAVTPHELLEEHEDPQMISRLRQFKIFQHWKHLKSRKPLSLISKSVNPNLVKSATDADLELTLRADLEQAYRKKITAHCFENEVRQIILEWLDTQKVSLKLKLKALNDSFSIILRDLKLLNHNKGVRVHHVSDSTVLLCTTLWFSLPL